MSETRVDADRSCYRKVRFHTLEDAEARAAQLELCVYRCGVCGGFHLTKSIVGEPLVSEVNLKDFLKRHGFRFSREHDKGMEYTNGAGYVVLRKSYANHKNELRTVMDQIRVLAKKKERITADARRNEEFQLKRIGEQTTAPVSWPQEAKVYSAAELINEMTKAGEDAEKIAGRLNAQGIKHPQSHPWTADDIREFRHEPRQRPETPEEHHEAQTATAAAAEPEPEESGGGKRQKLKGAERLYVFGRIKALINQRASDEQIAAALTAEKCLQANGKPITPKFVRITRDNWVKVPARAERYAAVLIPRTRPLAERLAPPPERAPVVATPEPPPVPRSRFGLPLSVDAVLADKGIDAQTRLNILLLFVTVPHSVVPVLDDEKISAEQKYAVVEAVGSRKL